jgi:hypothetical protein
MNGIQPVVRYMVICEDIVIDPGNANRVSLQGCLWNIQSPLVPPYPDVAPVLCVFALLTNCHGGGTFRLLIGDLTADLYDSGPLVQNFSANPLQVYGWPFRIRNVRFPQAGVYEVTLEHNGIALATQPLRLL